MIKSVTVTNHRGESLKMELTSPEKSGFVIASITGLEPPKATINATELSVGDGSVFNSARANTRNIVLTLAFLPFPTIEACRERSYKYFPIKEKIRLTVTTDLRELYIDGYVESNDAEIFSSQVATQISIICPQPAMIATSETQTIVSGSENVFEFPIENDGIEFPLDDGYEFSILHNEYVANISYKGDLSTGFLARMYFLGRARNIGLHNYYTEEELIFNTDKIEAIIGGQISNGDYMIINTVIGEKGITYNHAGVDYNVLNCVSKDADWFQLKLGMNTIYYTAEEGINNVQLSIYNNVLYQGV